jgi:spore coat polysaccharide biosynthesis predicted glycosyltransferase SpsG
VLLNGDPARPEPADLVFLRGATTPDGETPGTVRTGFTYEVVRPEITDLRPPTPWAGTAVGDILVSFGASDPGEQTEALLAATVPLAGLHVMIGPGFTRERRARIEGLLAGRGSVLDDPDAFAPLLAETDCFVSVGGQSVLEALHLGRPVAAVRWGSLADDVTWLSDAGLVADLGPADGALEQLATLMARPDVLAQHARAGFATIDAQGANRCLDAIATELLDTGLGDRLPTD